MSEKVVIPVGDQDRIQDSGSPANDYRASATEALVEVEPLDSGYYNQGENVVEVTVGSPSDCTSPTEATESGVQPNISKELVGESPGSTHQSPNTTPKGVVAKDSCPGISETHASKELLFASKHKPKYGRCKDCGVSLTSEGTHRKRRTDAGTERGPREN